MKVLREKDVIRMMREEWESRLRGLVEKVDLTFKTKLDGSPKNILSPELSLLHVPSKLRYKIVAVGANECVLANPEGEEFVVDKGTLEAEYEID